MDGFVQRMLKSVGGVYPMPQIRRRSRQPLWKPSWKLTNCSDAGVQDGSSWGIGNYRIGTIRPSNRSCCREKRSVRLTHFDVTASGVRIRRNQPQGCNCDADPVMPLLCALYIGGAIPDWNSMPAPPIRKIGGECPVGTGMGREGFVRYAWLPTE